MEKVLEWPFHPVGRSVLLRIRENIRIEPVASQRRPQFNVRHHRIVHLPPDIVGSSGDVDVMSAVERAAVINDRRQPIQQFSGNLLLRMAVELAEVERLGETDLGFDFLRDHFLALRVPCPFEALQWADQDFGRECDELPSRFVVVVATCGVLAPRLTFGVEVALDDVDQLVPFFGTHEIGEQIELRGRGLVLRTQEAAGPALCTFDFFVRDNSEHGIEDVGLTDPSGK